MYICNECGNLNERKVVCKSCAYTLSRRSFFGILSGGIVTAKTIELVDDSIYEPNNPILDLLDKHIERIRPLMSEIFEKSACVSRTMSEHSLGKQYNVSGIQYRIPIEVSS